MWTREYSADTVYANNEDEVALTDKDFYLKDFIKFCDDCLIQSRKVQMTSERGVSTNILTLLHNEKVTLLKEMIFSNQVRNHLQYSLFKR